MGDSGATRTGEHLVQTLRGLWGREEKEVAQVRYHKDSMVTTEALGIQQGKMVSQTSFQ